MNLIICRNMLHRLFYIYNINSESAYSLNQISHSSNILDQYKPTLLLTMGPRSILLILNLEISLSDRTVLHSTLSLPSLATDLNFVLTVRSNPLNLPCISSSSTSDLTFHLDCEAIMSLFNGLLIDTENLSLI